MSLSESVTRLLAEQKFRVGLAFGDVEVADAGYQRAAPSWRGQGSRTSSEVTFGPFQAGVEFDRAVLFDQSGPLEHILFEEPVRVAAGMTFTYRTTIRTTV